SQGWLDGSSRTPNYPARSSFPATLRTRPTRLATKGGQLVTSLVTAGDTLFASTSAKDPCIWNSEQKLFLAPEKWQTYGMVHELNLPGHLQGATRWTTGPV
ncbi:MAG: hypothetical protein ACK55I_37280, partial [bacterium]